MAFKTADRVKETTTTTGTGTIDLDGASAGFVTFASVTTTLDTVYYVISSSTSTEFEVGQGVVTHGTPDTLTRSTVISSSNAGALVNFSAGEKDVFLTAPADKLIQINPDNDLNVSADDITLTPGATGSVDIDGDFKLNTTITGLDIVFDQSERIFKLEDTIKLAIGTGSGTAGDAEIYQSGSSTIWDQKSGFLRFYDNGVNDIFWNPGSYVRIYNDTALQLGSSGLFSMDYDSANTAVIFNDNQTTKDFRFQQAGSDKIIFSFENWEFQDGVTASFGAGSDLSIEHDGTDSIIQNSTGDLLIQNTLGSDFVRVNCNLDSANPALIAGILNNVNISSAAGVKSIINTADIELNRGSWSVTSSRITCGSGQDGIYYIAIDVRADSAVQRIAPMVLIRRNGSNITQYCATGYIRNASGHNNASLHQEVVCSLTNGDYIEFYFANDGLAGTANTVNDFGYGVRVIRLPMTYTAV